MPLTKSYTCRNCRESYDFPAFEVACECLDCSCRLYTPKLACNSGHHDQRGQEDPVEGGFVWPAVIRCDSCGSDMVHSADVEWVLEARGAFREAVKA